MYPYLGRYSIQVILRKTVVLLTALLILSGTGCLGTYVRTIYVKPGDPVRLRETVRNVKVWVYDKEGNAVESVMDLPDGWYCLSKER